MFPFLSCIAMTISEVLAFYYVLQVFCEMKASFQKYKIGIYIFLTAIITLWAYVLDAYMYIKIPVVIITYIVVAKPFVRTKAIVLWAINMVYYNYLMLMEYMMMIFVLRLDLLDEIENPNAYLFSRLIMVLLEMIVNFAVIYYCKRKQGKLKDFNEVLTPKDWWGIFIISLVSSTLLMIAAKESGMPDAYHSNLFTGLVGIAIAFLDIVVIRLFIQSLRKQKYILESEAILSYAKNEVALYKTLSENLEKERRKSHEFDNQISAIKGMLDLGETQQLREYVNNVSEKKEKAMLQIHTNHVMIDAILNSKAEEFRQEGILFVTKINDLSQISIADEDLVILLSNLLNNAKEASHDTKEKIIRMKFVVDDKDVVLSIENTHENVIKVQEGDLVTTKLSDTTEHGIGLKNVKEVVEKYHGKYLLDYDEHYFKVTIIIPVSLF